MPSPWNAELLCKFHTTVEALYTAHENPVGDIAYRDDYRLEDLATRPYTMRFLDELQVADHVAFLAHAQEGAQAVSAVCVEERSNGLLLRLASNERPLQDVAAGLWKMSCSEISAAGSGRVGDSVASVAECHYHVLEAHSSPGISKDIHCQRAFENVLKLSKHRILQRIRPPWGRFVRPEEPL